MQIIEFNMIKHSGFTLVELMASLLVAAILLTVGVPAFTTMIKNQRVTGFANDLVMSLNLARSDAVTSGSYVTVCRSTDGANCNHGVNWEDGWMVFRDDDGDGIFDLSDDEILRVNQSFAEKNMSLLLVKDKSTDPSYIQYKPSALPVKVLSFGLCDNDKDVNGRTISVGRTGKISIAEKTDC